MNLPSPVTMRDPIRHDLSGLRASANAIMILGVVMVILGTAMIAAPFAATLGSMLFLSALLLIGGGGQVLGAFWMRHWSGFFLQLLVGILYLVLGVLTFERPFQLEAALTLLIAASLLVGGAFRIGVAVSLRFDGWLYPVINGVISILLGLMVWRQWPLSGLYVIGLFLGVEILLQGWTWLMMGMLVRRAAKPAA